MSDAIAQVAAAFPALIELPGLVTKPPTGFRPNSPAQQEYILSTEPNVWFWGNRGGGKSLTARWTCHARAMSYPGYRYAILRTSFPELIKNHLIYLDAEMEALGGDYHGSKFIARYPNGSLGFYMQAETDQQVRNALGVEMMECVFDEAPTFKWDHIVMISSSIRVPPNVGLTPLKRLLGNPTGPCIDEIWKYFVDKDVDLEDDRTYQPEEWRSIYIDMRDNKDLDVEAYTKQLGAGLPLHLRKAWLDGEKYDYGQLFEVLKYAKHQDTGEPILDEQGRQKPYHVIHELPAVGGKPVVYFDHDKGRWIHPDWVRIFRAYDHGYWPDPAVCLWIAEVGRQLVVFKEKVWWKDVAKDIAEDIVGESKGMNVVTTYCDPSIDVQNGADIVTIRDTFELNGVPMDPSVNNREYYAHAINSALKMEVEPHVPRLRLYQPGCPYLAKYLPQMRYDERNTQAMADHKHDHAPVALAYFLMSVMPIGERTPLSGTKLPKWMRGPSREQRLGIKQVRRNSLK